MFLPDCLIPQFEDLTEGNWRNSFYITCSGCKWTPHPGCGDFLYVPDIDGRPLLFPLSLIERHYGRIDKSECLGDMSNLLFRELFHRCMEEWRSQELCPFIIAFNEQYAQKSSQIFSIKSPR